jgi:aryl-alcohol dehydrogenase-like predicted oxidoreductase
LEENLEAAAIRFSQSEIDELDAALPLGATEGPRYTHEMMLQIDR